MKVIYIFGLLAVLLSSCGKKGCTDPSALNYDENANKYDGSCEYADIIEEDSLNLRINFRHFYNGNELDFSSNYPITNGDQVNLAVFKYYLSNLHLTSSTGSVLASEIELIDLAQTTSVEFKATPGNYTGLNFDIGVPKNLNSADPTVYPIGHPLSALNNTYWTWSTQYRFILLEGKADTTGNGSFNLNYVYHTGLDTCFKSADPYSINFTVPDYNDSVAIDVSFHFDEFWTYSDSIDIKNEYTTHATDDLDLALKVSNAFAKAFHP